MQRLDPADVIVGRCYQNLVGRGATALWVALEAIALHDGKRGEVIIPDLVCPAVLEAVLAAGYSVRLADVDPHTYTLTPATVRQHINRETHAIVVVHLFGHTAPIESISQLAAELGIRLIEDAAQGIGGYTQSGKAVGAHGDFSFVSFHESKQIRGKGGILFYDDVLWKEPVRMALSQVFITKESPSHHLLQTSLRDLYHGLGQAVRLGILPEEKAARSFREAIPMYRTLLLRAFDDTTDNCRMILQEWKNLETHIARRNEIACSLKDKLSDLPVTLSQVRDGDAIWRYTVRFPNRDTTDRFVLALRNQGGLVSNLYYPLNQLFHPNRELGTRKFAPCIANLWVDETVDDTYVLQVRKAAEMALSSAVTEGK